jgi:hypothetical protein
VQGWRKVLCPFFLTTGDPMIKAASIIFVLVFGALLIGLLCLFAFGVAHILVSIVRFFKPDFAVYRPAGLKREETLADTKKVALDYLFARKREEMRRQHAQSTQTAAMPMPEPVKDESALNEWDLSALSNLINAPRVSKTTIYSDAKRTEDKAEYCLLRYFTLPNGQNHPRFLCTKLSQRGRGLRVAFASLSERRIKLDFVSAMRLAEAIGPDVLLAPANAAARITVKRKESQHASA